MNHGPHGIHGRKSFWRSRLFWLGVSGLVFLMWAWADSMKRGSWVSIGWGPRVCSFSQDCSKIRIMGFNDPFDPKVRSGLHFDGGHYDLLVLVPDLSEYQRSIGNWFGAAVPKHRVEHSNGEIKIYRRLAFWFVTAIYLSTWLGVTVTWQRWKGKKLKEVA